MNIENFEIIDKKLKSSYGEQNMEIRGIALIDSINYTVVYSRIEPFGAIRFTEIEPHQLPHQSAFTDGLIEVELQEYLGD